MVFFVGAVTPGEVTNTLHWGGRAAGRRIGVGGTDITTGRELLMELVRLGGAA